MLVEILRDYCSMVPHFLTKTATKVFVNHRDRYFLPKLLLYKAAQLQKLFG